MRNDREKLLKRVAYLYYIENKTQSEIARELDIYRTTISRMLKEARDSGLVKISIDGTDSRVFALEQELKMRFNLVNVIIAETETHYSDEEKNDALSVEAANYFKRVIKDDMAIGVSWGQTLGDAIRLIESRKKVNATFVPLVGGPSQINTMYHVNTLIYELGRKFSANGLYINAMVIQEDVKTCEAILKSKYFQEIKNYWKNLDVALVGVGGVLNSKNSQWRDLLSDNDIEMMKLREVVGDCCCRFYDYEGKIISSELSDRTIGLTLEQLSQVPISIGVARGVHKVRAIKPLLDKKIINHLITDEETAILLLK